MPSSLSTPRAGRRGLSSRASPQFFAGLALYPHVPFDPLYPVSFGFPLGLSPGAGYIWVYSLLNICAALLIDCIAHRRFAPGLFESRALSYIGKISCGIYIFHYPIQALLRKAIPNSPLLVQLGFQLSLTLVIASLSFYFWEMPSLRKKDVWFKTAVPPKH